MRTELNIHADDPVETLDLSPELRAVLTSAEANCYDVLASYLRDEIPASDLKTLARRTRLSQQDFADDPLREKEMAVLL